MSEISGFDRMKPSLEKAKQDQSPLVRWMASSVEEIYFGGDSAMARIKGIRLGMDVKYAPKALRLVALHDSQATAVSIVISSGSKLETKYLARRLRKEVAKLPYTGINSQTTLDLAQNSIINNGQQFLGAFELSETLKGDELIQIIYPKTYIRALDKLFLRLGTKMPESELRTVSFGIAIKLLQSTAPTGNEPIILEREDSTS